MKQKEEIIKVRHQKEEVKQSKILFEKYIMGYLGNGQLGKTNVYGDIVN